MQWTSFPHASQSIERFSLSAKESAEPMRLRYNPLHHSGRLEYAQHHLLFFLSVSGLRGNKFLFENEYGVEIGHLRFEGQGGTLTLDQRKLGFVLPQVDGDDLIFPSGKHLPEPLFCGLDFSLTGSARNSPEQWERYACLILGLFWYLFPHSIPEANKSTASIAFH